MVEIYIYTMTSSRETDYLEQDDKIRGQNYVCMSFISPEDILKKKECFFISKYVQNFSKTLNNLFDELAENFPESREKFNLIKENNDCFFNVDTINDNYKFYVTNNVDELEKEFYEKNEFQTSIRGFKVRGSYDTLEEAKARSESLRKKEGNKFNIFVAEVGCWCPWAPNPEQLQDQEFVETQLNTLMKKYHENNEYADIHFNERKSELKSKLFEVSPITEDNEEEPNEIIKSNEANEETV